MPRSGLRNDVLLDHDASDIVPSEAKTKLARLQTLSDPGRLHIQNRLQIEPGDRECLQVLDRSRFFFD